MIKFTALDKNLNILKDFLPFEKSGFCELSVGTKYAWGKVIKTDFAVVDDTLILKETSPEYTNAFYYPIGKNPQNALCQIEEFCKSTGTPLLFCCLEKQTADLLAQRYNDVQVYFDRTWSDYIYSAQSFKTYSGKKLSGQRNHVNKFKKLYPSATFKIATDADQEKLVQFAKSTIDNANLQSWTEKAEAEYIQDYVKNALNLNQLVGYVEFEGKVISLSVGEKVNEYLLVHLEKADKNYQGVYPFTASEFVKAFADQQIEFVNREEDCGDLGLRTSKMQYQPLQVKEKYYAKVKTPIDNIVNPNLKTQRLSITQINQCDGKDYFNLYTDQQLNKWWGYDYNQDLNGQTPTEQYFLDFQQSLKNKGEEFSFAVRLDGKMIGEIPLYNFDFYGGGEVGFRFFENFQGKGYATESVNAVIDYFFNELKGKRLKTRCFKQNKKSFALIQRLGFEQFAQDQTHFYFEMKR